MFQKENNLCKAVPHTAILSLPSLMKSAYSKKYFKGEVIFQSGDINTHIYIITSGLVKLFRETYDGRQVILGIAEPDDIIGTIPFFNNKKYSFNAETIDSTQLLKISHAQIEKLLYNNSQLFTDIIQSISSLTERLQLQWEHIGTMNAAQRIACFLIRAVSPQETNTACIDLPCNKELIAGSLGIKRETFSRELRKLKSLGVEVKNKKIYIKDLKALTHFTCSSCSYYS